MPHACLQPAKVNFGSEPKPTFDRYHQVVLKGLGKSRLQVVECYLRHVISR